MPMTTQYREVIQTVYSRRPVQARRYSRNLRHNFKVLSRPSNKSGRVNLQVTSQLAPLSCAAIPWVLPALSPEVSNRTSLKHIVTCTMETTARKIRLSRLQFCSLDRSQYL